MSKNPHKNRTDLVKVPRPTTDCRLQMHVTWLVCGTKHALNKHIPLHPSTKTVFLSNTLWKSKRRITACFRIQALEDRTGLSDVTENWNRYVDGREMANYCQKTQEERDPLNSPHGFWTGRKDGHLKTKTQDIDTTKKWKRVDIVFGCEMCI